MTKLDEFAKNIREQISYTKKSMSQIARELGLTSSAIYDYTNARSFPSITILMKLCEYFDCSYEELLGEPKGVLN